MIDDTYRSSLGSVTAPRLILVALYLQLPMAIPAGRRAQAGKAATRKLNPARIIATLAEHRQPQAAAQTPASGSTPFTPGLFSPSVPSAPHSSHGGSMDDDAKSTAGRPSVASGHIPGEIDGLVFVFDINTSFKM